MSSETLLLVFSAQYLKCDECSNGRDMNYSVHSKLHEPELHAAVFSMVQCLSGMVLVIVMFTNKVYLLLTKTEPLESRHSINSVSTVHSASLRSVASTMSTRNH